jgi:hypothetical protein
LTSTAAQKLGLAQDTDVRPPAGPDFASIAMRLPQAAGSLVDRGALTLAVAGAADPRATPGSVTARTTQLASPAPAAIIR